MGFHKLEGRVSVRSIVMLVSTGFCLCLSSAFGQATGVCEGINGAKIVGYAIDPDDPEREVVVHILIDKKHRYPVTAKLPHKDADKDGHAFEFEIPAGLQDQRKHRLRAFVFNSPRGPNPPLEDVPEMFQMGWPTIGGDVKISAAAGESEIVIRTKHRFAGAIGSLTWNGLEFVDAHDHGRQIQSASNFQLKGQSFGAECFNPTEAGRRLDGVNAVSSSRLLALNAKPDSVETLTDMAFWLGPNEAGPDCPTSQTTRVRSDHRLLKEVTIGVAGFSQVLEYTTTFLLPSGFESVYQQFEVVTGYMPARFSEFWTFDPETSTRAKLDDGPGEQALPVIFSTPDGGHAMGVWNSGKKVGYGRWRFAAQKLVKWNAVQRRGTIDGRRIQPATPFHSRSFVFVGSLADVERDMAGIYEKFKEK